MPMPCVDEIFRVSGPFHLTSIDWKEAHHRRWVAASLVKGVYVYEKDRQQKRTGTKALAPIWWEFFEFKLINILIDEDDSSAFGAIFEYKPHTTNHDSWPWYVVAFRGTITRAATRKRDICLDIKIPFNGLVKNTRIKAGFQVVQELVTRVGSENIWLTGHSLGAAIALRIGKDMAKMGCPIETYLFNPPYGSIPIDKLASGHLNSGIRIAKSVATAGISRLLNGRSINAKHTCSLSHDDPFTRLCSWVPYMFVNPNDLICSEFIGHFEHRGRMEAIGAGRIERIATQTSILCLLSGALLGRDGTEASFLVPSAFVTKNMVDMKQNMDLAHGLEQWWKPHCCFESKLYQLR